ncbi:MAG: response regulator [Bdellovibrionales bacterium]|nr:response regulator [Bdellovibrionales bacterium]
MAKILVVDDSPKVVKIVQSLLVLEGYDVVSAPDSFSAKDLLDKYRFDLVLLDVNLPFKDGFSTLKSWREIPRLKFLPVVLLTGRNSRRDIEKAASLDVTTYILKPIEPRSFLDKMTNLLKGKSSTNRDVTFNENDERTVGVSKCRYECRVLRISEIGVDVILPTFVKDGVKIEISAPIFSEIDVQLPITFTVVSCIPINNGFKTRLAYTDLSFEETETIRCWLLSSNAFSMST